MTFYGAVKCIIILMSNKSGERLIMLFEKDNELLKLIQLSEKFDCNQWLLIESLYCLNLLTEW